MPLLQRRGSSARAACRRRRFSQADAIDLSLEGSGDLSFGGEVPTSDGPAGRLGQTCACADPRPASSCGLRRLRRSARHGSQRRGRPTSSLGGSGSLRRHGDGIRRASRWTGRRDIDLCGGAEVEQARRLGEAAQRLERWRRSPCPSTSRQSTIGSASDGVPHTSPRSRRSGFSDGRRSRPRNPGRDHRGRRRWCRAARPGTRLGGGQGQRGGHRAVGGAREAASRTRRSAPPRIQRLVDRLLGGETAKHLLIPGGAAQRRQRSPARPRSGCGWRCPAASGAELQVHAQRRGAARRARAASATASPGLWLIEPT